MLVSICDGIFDKLKSMSDSDRVEVERSVIFPSIAAYPLIASTDSFVAEQMAYLNPSNLWRFH